jgi:putative transposase
MLDPDHPRISRARQCRLLALPRSTSYLRPKPRSATDLRLMRVIDELYLLYPFYGSRQMLRTLRKQGYTINRKRVRRLMLEMGLEAIYQKPNLSRANVQHRIYPYLLRNLKVNRPNRVFATDVTYVPIQGGFIYLCAVIDWYSRAVLAWELSNTLDATFCANAMQRAIAEHGVPDIVNTDQGSQFTSAEFTEPLLKLGIKLSMDGKGRCLDNVFVERLWRTVKYEEIYLKSYRSQIEAYANLDTFFRFYNEERPHSAFGDARPLTPMEVYRGAEPIAVNQ